MEGSKAELDKLRTVPPDDRRLAVAGVLIGNGEVIGKANVLSSDIAVTTAEVANAARSKVEALANDPSTSAAPLMLVFPQFVGSPGVYPVPAEIQAVDKERGFGALKFSGMLPMPVYPDLLGIGGVPADGTGCDILCSDVSQKVFFQISGRVSRRRAQQFRLHLEAGAPMPVVGAPVFSDYRLVGIVASEPLGGAGVAAFGFVEVLSVAAMAGSEVTPAVRNLFRRVEGDPNKPKPFPTGIEIAQTQAAESAGSDVTVSPPSDLAVAGAGAALSATLTLTPNKESEASPVDLSDADLFARLSPSSRRALGRAAGMRGTAGQGAIHMEHLIAGLFESWKSFFGRAGIDEEELRKIVQSTPDEEEGLGKVVQRTIPRDYRAVEIDKMPAMSRHVRKALTAATDLADRRGAKQIRSTHLLYGALSVDNCRLISALLDRGVEKGSISAEDERFADGGPDMPATVPTPPEPGRVAANPTPKVDSDLWSEEDRLGYEAYARTIASLITHKETKPPLTIGIKAPWGAGKTTLMKRVQHLLDGDAKLSEENRSGTMQQGQPSLMTLRELLKELKDSTTPSRLIAKPSKEGEAYGLEPRITVWFNAWKYQTSEQVWAGMAHCIISQITARMGVKERELFWARLHGRRVKADEVRRKVYEVIARQMVPLALVVLVLCAVVIWVAAALPVLGLTRHVIQGGSVLLGLVGLIWKGWSKLGDKASGTMRELIREPDYEGKMGYLHLVESDIREVLQLATAASATQEKPEGNPLVVFVDDLDRCAPNKVAEVVEAINLFLCGDYPNCVFVIGMEPGMVAAALEVANKDVIAKAEEMGLVDRTVPVGWRFMERIVQLPIMIPPPTEAGRRGYVHSLTGFGVESIDMTFVVPGATPITAVPVPILRPAQHGAEEEVKVQNYIKIIGSAKDASEAARKGEDVVARTPVQDRWAAREAGSRVYEQALTAHDPVMARFLDEVAQLVDGNPRQIKRYVNVFRFYSTLRHSLRLEGVIPRDDLPSDQVLAKFVALSIQWPHAVDCLRVKKDVKVDGRKVSLLELLETESKKTVEDEAASDAGWEKFVGKDGLGMGAWAGKRAFREFLSRGESLCAKEGHGLW